ncbi:UNVERIFIED_CONTAM: hypothetical protein GTU68_014282 [Idotea baltica]|nr:hypothetical protein [Idotea baltica]
MALDAQPKTVWPAPAKINWFLHVVGKRPDGYHELQTVFQFLDYGDEMTFAITENGDIQRDYDLGFSEEVDLCLRAAKLLKKIKGDDTCGVTISLNKRLPMGGGLGGGSSNAATTLIALNHLWGVGLNRQELADLGLKLGADVPIFIFGQSAWAEGIGEQLTAIDLVEKWFLVLNPDVNVSTKQIFCHKQLTASPQMMKIRALEKGINFEFGKNQLEPIVRAEYPQVNAIIEWLSKYGKPRMSGSGGSVFMPLVDQQQGVKLLEKKPANSTGFVAKGLNLHPLLDVI